MISEQENKKRLREEAPERIKIKIDRAEQCPYVLIGELLEMKKNEFLGPIEQ